MAELWGFFGEAVDQLFWKYHEERAREDFQKHLEKGYTDKDGTSEYDEDYVAFLTEEFEIELEKEKRAWEVSIDNIEFWREKGHLPTMEEVFDLAIEMTEKHE